MPLLASLTHWAIHSLPLDSVLRLIAFGART
jgi:hypothetical protein